MQYDQVPLDRQESTEAIAALPFVSKVADEESGNSENESNIGRATALALIDDLSNVSVLYAEVGGNPAPLAAVRTKTVESTAVDLQIIRCSVCGA